MALKTIKYYTTRCFCSDTCGEVAICLSDGWRAKTANGSGFFFGSISGGAKIVPASSHYLSLCGSPCSTNTEQVYEYCITYDDSQFATDLVTSLKYAPLSSDILNISQDACILKRLMDFIEEQAIGAFTQEFTTGNTSPIASGKKSIRIQVTSGSITINGLTYNDPTYITFGAETGKVLPEIVISGTGTYVWEALQ